jgi:hypothetical protein
MTWLTWRLHRNEAVIGRLLFAGLIAVMFTGMQNVDSAYDAAREGGCFGDNQGPLCSERLAEYFSRSASWDNMSILLHGIPIAVATLLAIPTLHELERGTHRLAWTQSISRGHWVRTRIGFLTGVAVLVAIIWTVVAAQWRESVLRVDARGWGQNSFELSPPVLIGYGLFAVALVLAAGAIVRLVPAIGLLIVGFVSVRLVATFVLREHYRDPIHETSAGTPGADSAARGDQSWIIDESWLNGAGARVSWDEMHRLCSPDTIPQYSETSYQQCLADNGFQYYVTYHPVERFYQFQAIETALFLALATGLLAFAYWWLARRSA